jgi:glucan phosphorylase
MSFRRFLASVESSQVFRRGEMVGIDQITQLVSSQRPLVYWSMELYDKEENDIKGGGGLGILAADTRRNAEQLGIPFVIVTPFYTQESHQQLDGFWQQEQVVDMAPDERFREFCMVDVSTMVHPTVPLRVYDRELGSTRLVVVTEPNFGELYPGANNSDHRLYQEIALGFGGYKALKMEGIDAAFMQLNEAPTVFAALARLDDLMSFGHSLEVALRELRAQTLYTNHTLVPAVEGEFSGDQFHRLVMPNIHHEELRQWVWRPI